MARRVQSGVTSDINVTPMADIMLVLLIIFMITAPLLQSGITVTLPKARHPEDANPDKGVIIAVSRDGAIYLKKQEIALERLPDELRSEFPDAEINKRIFLKADAAVAYGRVVEVVNYCRDAGIDKIGLMAEKEKD